ncbi:MAG: alpha/beta fold hydrolase [Proteobacteria bacterium]|nr:alpha/beta fold hydrolase [Pseudomonadota bacterium]
MIRKWLGGGLALVVLALAGTAEAGPPRLERDRCVFRAPRGERLECYTMVVPENREKPQGSEVRLKVAVLKARRVVAPDPVIYLAGGPGDSPLVASSAGADPLSEGDWWNDTASIRKKRDVVILSQRGAPGSTPSLDCFESRASELARARRRAVTEGQERDILLRCRAEFDRKKIDVSMYSTPTLADDVADLARLLKQPKVNLYGISYGTRWGLEVMRRHPDLVRSAVLDGVYPPQINGDQNEPEVVRAAFEQLAADCATDAVCKQRNPGFSNAMRAVVEAAEKIPLQITLQLDDGPQNARLDGTRIMMVLMHMMRIGEAGMIPEAISGIERKDLRVFQQFAEDFEDDEGGLLEPNAQQFGGLFNTIECRETWAAIDLAARDRAIAIGGIYGLDAKASKLPTVCPAWNVPPAPPGERQPVSSNVPTLLLSGAFDWLTPPAWGKEAARTLSVSRHVVFRAQGHGVSSQDACAARLRDEFIDNPDPRAVPPCRTNAAPDFAAAADRVKTLP